MKGPHEQPPPTASPRHPPLRFNYRLRLKSHMALALFIYLYLNEDTESLIKVVIVADSVRSGGSWMSDQTGPRVQTHRVACGHMHRLTLTPLDAQLISTRVCMALYSPWGWGAGKQAVPSALAARGQVATGFPSQEL